MAQCAKQQSLRTELYMRKTYFRDRAALLTFEFRVKMVLNAPHSEMTGAQVPFFFFDSFANWTWGQTIGKFSFFLASRFDCSSCCVWIAAYQCCLLYTSDAADE